MKHIYFIIRGGLLLLLIFLAWGCSPVRILGTHSSQGFNLEDYHTYRFFEIAIDTIDTPEFFQRIGWIEEDLRSNFTERGLNFTKEDPSLLVNIGLVFEEKSQMRETTLADDAPKYIGSMNYAWQSEVVEMGKYKEGTLVMHLVDAESNILLWEGILQSVVVKDDEQARKNISKGVKMLFKQLE